MAKTREEIVAEGKTCHWCDQPATQQTLRGQDAGEGYYCDKCYAKGLKIEEEAMYGHFQPLRY